MTLEEAIATGKPISKDLGGYVVLFSARDVQENGVALLSIFFDDAQEGWEIQEDE